MSESPIRTFKQIDRERLDDIVDSFVRSFRLLRILDGSAGSCPPHCGLEEMAQVVEHVGRRLRDECCEKKLRGHAILADQILTIATTRIMA